MKILVINAGSTTLKYQLIDSENESVIAKGLCERIGGTGQISYNKRDNTKGSETVELPDHGVALKLVIERMTDPNFGVISDLKEIDAVGHRVVHGGERFSSSVRDTSLCLWEKSVKERPSQKLAPCIFHIYIPRPPGHIT